jgi:hypothetical protein
MLRTSDERFILTRRVAGQPLEKLNEPWNWTTSCASSMPRDRRRPSA